jgi:hypothetical protein
MCLYIQAVPLPSFTKTKLKVINKRTSILPKGRQEMVQDALKMKCTHLLFIDTDQTFPSDTAHRLIKHGKNIVGCNVATKTIPSSPTARLASEEWSGGTPLYTDPDSEGSVEVWRVGTGVMLLNLNLFEDLPLPWFPIKWEESIKDFRGEDWCFCEIASAAGHKIWVDQDLSKEIGHVGNFTYTHDVVGKMVREEVELTPALLS